MGLYNGHFHERGGERIGSNPETHKSRAATDRITYTLNVIRYAFEESGDQ